MWMSSSLLFEAAHLACGNPGSLGFWTGRLSSGRAVGSPQAGLGQGLGTRLPAFLASSRVMLLRPV